MATKTISLELDAYEKLRRAKRGGESFSAVVRRARFSEEEVTGMVMEKRAGYGVAISSPETAPEYWDRIERKERKGIALESFEAAVRRQEKRNRQWKSRGKPGKQAGGDRGWTREQLYTDRLGEE